MKTPIQELIDLVENKFKIADELYDYFMEKATQMLEKEKEVIEDAWYYGRQSYKNDTSEDYYNETFNTKEF